MIGTQPLKNFRRTYIQRFERIRQSKLSIRDKNHELTALMAVSSYVRDLFLFVWSASSNSTELYDELRSLTFLKRVESKRFPPVKRKKICGYTFKAIKYNWITVAKRHNRDYGLTPLSQLAPIDSLTLPSTVRPKKGTQEISIPCEDGSVQVVSYGQLNEAIKKLMMVDRTAGTVLKLKLQDKTESEIAQKLKLTPNQTRVHVRRAQQELKVVLVQQLGE